jgi:hypothetical protein
MKIIKQSIDYIETWILKVISHVTHTKIESKKLKKWWHIMDFMIQLFFIIIYGYMSRHHKNLWFSETIYILLIFSLENH